MKKMVVVLNEKEKALVKLAKINFFLEETKRYEDGKLDSLGYLVSLFKIGTFVIYPSGAIGNVKLSFDDLKEFVGDDEYNYIVKTAQAVGISLWAGISAEFIAARIMAAVLKTVSPIGYLMYTTMTVVSGYATYKFTYDMFKPVRKEENSYDKGIQEDRGVQGQVSDMSEQRCPA